MADRLIRWSCVVAFAWVLMTTGVARAQGPATQNPLDTYTWRYEKITKDNQELVRRVRMKWDEAKEWDRVKREEYVQQAMAGQIPGQPPPGQADPNAIAAWKQYYDQLELWQEYIKQSVMDGQELQVALTEIAWTRGGPAQGGAGYPGGQSTLRGPEALVAANQNKSLDSQAGEFFTFGGGPGGQQQQQQAPITKKDIEEQLVKVFEGLKEQAKKEDAKVLDVALKMLNGGPDGLGGYQSGLQQRDTQRRAYKNWLEEQKDKVREAALEWGKLDQGDVVMVDGVQYELYSPAIGLPKGLGRPDVVRVVTEKLTPYDLMNNDGTLKKPAEQ